MKTELHCPTCKKGPFKGSHGLHVHKLRKHSTKGKEWGTTASKTAAPRKSRRLGAKNTMTSKEAIYQILQKPEHSEGLSISDLIKGIRAIG